MLPTRLECADAFCAKLLPRLRLMGWIGFDGCGQLIDPDPFELHKQAAYCVGWFGGAGTDSFLAQFVAVTQSPSS